MSDTWQFRVITYSHQAQLTGLVNGVLGSRGTCGLGAIKRLLSILLYSTGNSTQYSVMAYMGNESKKKSGYMYN